MCDENYLGWVWEISGSAQVRPGLPGNLDTNEDGLEKPIKYFEVIHRPPI